MLTSMQEKTASFHCLNWSLTKRKCCYAVVIYLSHVLFSRLGFRGLFQWWKWGHGHPRLLGSPISWDFLHALFQAVDSDLQPQPEWEIGKIFSAEITSVSLCYSLVAGVMSTSKLSISSKISGVFHQIF